MRNIKLTLQYDGTDYRGWQIQKREITIQGTIEKALFNITGSRSRIIGASRTDAGVHAVEQVAAFKTESVLDSAVFVRAFNANLPDDIRVIKAEEVSEDFHPRYHARNKVYTYLISRIVDCSVFLKRYSLYIPYRLNCEDMEEAANFLIGRHDLSSFRVSGCNSKNPFREIIKIDIKELNTIDFIGINFDVPVIKISIQANAFLRHMARNIVGTLIDIGNKKILPQAMKEILQSRDRKNAGKTVPARGLFLEKIVY